MHRQFASTWGSADSASRRSPAAPCWPSWFSLPSGRAVAPRNAPMVSWASGAGRVQEEVADVVACPGVDDGGRQGDGAVQVGPIGGRSCSVRGNLGLLVDRGDPVDAEITV